MFLRPIKKIIQYLLPYGFVRQAQKRQGWYFQKPVPRFQLLEKRHDECIVLVNGPSAKAQLGAINEYGARADIVTVNFSLLYEEYRDLRPLAHFWVDPLFFLPRAQFIHPDSFDAHMSKLLSLCAAIDWPMTLYVPPQYYDVALQRGYATGCISLATVPVQPAPPNMPKKRRFRLMDQGAYGVGAQTVSIVAIYMAIAARYKKVWVAGFDADSFASLRVDENCRCAYTVFHGYDEKKENSHIRILHSELAKEFSSYFLLSRQLYEVKKYADYCGVELVNISKQSCLDFAPKGELGGPCYPFLKYGSLEWKAQQQVDAEKV